jgi:GNAT superfamily N-acetyltransferase
MMDPDLGHVRARAALARSGYFELGNQSSRHDHGRLVTNRATPVVRDANFAVPTSDDHESVLTWAQDSFAELPHIAFKLAPDSDGGFEARLIADGYLGGIDLLEMVLRGSLQVDPSLSVTIRPVLDDDDRERLAQLKRADWDESSARTGGRPVSGESAAQLIASKLAKCPPVQYWLAAIDGTDCAFVSSWPGVDAMGVVEDLFTLASFRHRGAATALIAAAVDDVRARGAIDVLIGADPNDAPKDMYRRMGFQPIHVQRAYWHSCPDA